MRVRLIQPAQLTGDGRPQKFKQLFLPSLALPTVAGLTPPGIDVGITTEYVEDVDFDEDVDLVGVTSLTCQATRAYQIADEFRRRGKKTILGGIHGSACTEEALAHFDSVLLGEAEPLWEQVLDDAGKDRLQKIYKSDDPPELERLTVPRYDLLDYAHYVVPPFARTPLLPIQTTRGCPYRCDFCSVTEFWGPKIRNKPVANVLAEIEALEPSRIFFSDDNIAANPRYAKELFAALKPLKLRWACQMSTSILKDPELIELAGEAGCHETLLGIESLSEESLNGINKSFNKVADYEALFTRLRKAGILAQASVIFGLDGDTPDSLRRMIDQLMQWDVNYIYIATLTPFPGTRLYDRLKREGRLFKKPWHACDMTQAIFDPKSITSDELESLVWEMYERCYSVRGILERTWRFREEYVRFFPRDNAIEETFFQFHMRSSILKRCHPFSLGLEKK